MNIPDNLSTVNLSLPASQDTEYFSKEAGRDFPVRSFITKKFGYFPCFYSSDNFYTEEIYHFLQKTAIPISSTINGNIEKIESDIIGFRGGTFHFLYKEFYVVSITVRLENDSDDHFYDEGLVHQNKPKKKTFNLTIAAPSGYKFPLKDFIPFIVKDNSSKISLFLKNSYGDFEFSPLHVNLPKNINLEVNYGKDFIDVYEEIKNSLSENSKGLYMFHGPHGTGKSTIIKKLATEVNREFIYLPASMLESFINDPACLQLLITKQNTVLILEDAEKMIMKREGDGLDSSAVSSLLNITDGILGDILNISVIVTYNCDTHKIDDALKRKGRLMVDYYFENLSVENAKILANHLNYNSAIIDDIKEPMSLAEIYNISKTNKFGKEKTRKSIGFK